MAEELKVEIIERDIIKPSSPTPSHLKIINLSCLDRIIPGVYTSLVLFYPNNNSILTSDQIYNHLKKSLSEALTLFYPLAGKIKDNTVIECHDDGATFVEAKFNGLLSTFLDQEQKDEALIGRFLPAAMESPEADTWPLLLVQATLFDCGGVAIGVCMSHKVGDATTLSIFLKTWAGTGIPDFEAASYYRSGDTFSYSPPGSSVFKRGEDGVVKRCLFDKSTIAALKAKFASDSVKQPTRAEVVTALILRCLVEANSRSTSGSSATPLYSLMTQAVNVRKRLEPPLPDNTVGNFVGLSALQVENDIYNETSIEALECQLQDMVTKLRQGLKDFTEKKAKRFRGDEADGLQAVVESYGEVVLFTRDGAEWIAFSSWCNFGFYEVDLGLGKPSCVTIPSCTYENLIYMMDTRDGDGVEIVLTLSKENVALFDNRLQEILSLASLN
ncbi:Salutaridinol 7-O-acetyltransferase [Morus notabilis]|uniref:Salutaridinol 7-O-acetyltransferase n=1 Tax=Morus notabilis TaxID=981085 RepID=W9SE09_9ROSA|nr:salutaridinol 7-O-acetyltransferase [Morus notabilis]EXC43572.1 Salutaridinol 7-O-acetyltransferase [Morus notabilis]